MKYIISILVLSNHLYSGHIQDYWKQLNNQKNFDVSKQSFCFKYNNKITSSNLNMSVRPASVSKLFTSLWALEKLGKDFRYKTNFFVKGNTLYIKGSKDPFFVSENILATFGEIRRDTKITTVVYDKNFYFNWSKNIDSITLSLKKVLNSDNWSSIFTQTVKNLEAYISNNSYTYTVPYNLDITDIKFRSSIKLKDFDYKLTHKSSPLLMHLKQVNVYSNNFYSDSLFDQLGSSKAFHKYLYSRFDINADDTFFFTGSGLGENRTTCSTALKVLSSLKDYSIKKKFDLTDLVSVAGTDSGTLRNRFNRKLKKSVLAKTGTLRHTSTLAGYLGNEKNITFAIFNHSYKTDSARELQNNFLVEYSKDKNIIPLDYKVKKYLSITNTDIKKETL